MGIAPRAERRGPLPSWRRAGVGSSPIRASPADRRGRPPGGLGRRGNSDEPRSGLARMATGRRARRAAVPGAGDTEPDRAGRHLPIARSPARPFPAAPGTGLPRRGRRNAIVRRFRPANPLDELPAVVEVAELNQMQRLAAKSTSPSRSRSTSCAWCAPRGCTRRSSSAPVRGHAGAVPRRPGVRGAERTRLRAARRRQTARAGRAHASLDHQRPVPPARTRPGRRAGRGAGLGAGARRSRLADAVSRQAYARRGAGCT